MKVCKKGLHEYEGIQCPVCRAETLRKWKQANRKRVNDQNRQWQQANKEKVSEQRREYRTANKEKISATKRKWGQANKAKKNTNTARWTRNREAKDPIFKLTRVIRAVICMAYKSKGYSKTTKTAKILGCDFEALQLHLINSALNNYGSFIDLPGVYHIDHIIPLASAVTEEDVRRLNHYTNLQLLYAEENMSLGAKGFRKKSRQAL